MMEYSERAIGRILIAMALALFLVACGGFDTDVPAMSPDGEEIREEAGEELRESKEDTPEDIEAHSFSLPVADEAHDDEPEKDENLCARVCFKFAWCSEDGSDFVECVNQCEETQFQGVIMDSELGCFDEADSCREAGFCENEIEACLDVCGVHAFCGVGREINDCQKWCVGEIHQGRLDWGVHGCIDGVGRSGRCEELSECGLSEPNF